MYTVVRDESNDLIGGHIVWSALPSQRDDSSGESTPDMASLRMQVRTLRHTLGTPISFKNTEFPRRQNK
jgi:hypothetical protein